jgi:hypothetical protein
MNYVASYLANKRIREQNKKIAYTPITKEEYNATKITIVELCFLTVLLACDLIIIMLILLNK